MRSGKKVMEVRNESEVWELLNKERKRRKGINENIEIEEWKEFFMRLLGGVEGRVVIEKEKEGWGRENDEMRVSRKEMKETLRKLKEGDRVGRYSRNLGIWGRGDRGVDLEVL